MSFVLEVEVPRLDRNLLGRLEAVTSAPDCLPVIVRGHRRMRNRKLWLSDRRNDVFVLSDRADWEEGSFSLDKDGRELLARTIMALTGVVPVGWTLRACWVGDPVAREEAVTACDLAGLARRSALRRDTKYRVTAN